MDTGKRVFNKEGRVVDVKYFKKADDFYVRHIIRECTYNGVQLKHLAEFKRERAAEKKKDASCKRDTLIAEDMERNADEIEKVLAS